MIHSDQFFFAAEETIAMSAFELQEIFSIKVSRQQFSSKTTFFDKHNTEYTFSDFIFIIFHP